MEKTPAVRRLLERLLTPEKYSLILATDEATAAETLERHPSSIHLVISSSIQVARLAISTRPESRVLLIPASHVADEAVPASVSILPKPFGSAKLLQRVFELLGQ